MKRIGRRTALLIVLGLALCVAPRLRAQEHAAEHGAATEHVAATGGHESGSAHGESGAHHVATWEEIATPMKYRAINFVLFVGLLVFLLRKPVAQALLQRRKEIEEVIKASAERKAWAEQMYVDYERRLSSIGKEIDDLKASLRKEGEVESKKILEHAQQLAQTLKQEAQQIAGADLEDFKLKLHHDVVETAAQVAKDTVIKTITEKDQDRLTRDFVGEIRSRS